MYTKERWSNFWFYNLYYQNVKKFFSYTLSKCEEVLLFFMYTMKTWSIFVSLMYTIETWSVFVFLIETWGIFCISNVHYRNVKQFFFFSCRLLKREVFFILHMYTIEIWNCFYFSHVYYQNVRYFCFSNVQYWNVKCFCFPHCNKRYFLYF